MREHPQVFVRCSSEFPSEKYNGKGANSDVANKIFTNMSARMAQSIREDLEITSNVRIRDVEEAQQRIVGIIRDLEERSELIILKGGKDDIIA